MNLLLWLSPLLLPLAAAVLLVARPGPRSSWLLVAAPAPAALLALIGPVLPAPALPWLLLDVSLHLDAIGRVLLGLTALVWAAAGVWARRDAEQEPGYGLWWLLALSGNLGVVLADDLLTFYAAFVVMTLAAYGLVVHTRSDAARRAGRVYLVLGVVGETLLLAGLLLAAAEAPGLRLGEVADAVAGSPARDLLVALLAAGFGIKAGVVGLHVWLPLAHPAAPFAASAVLSGAMIKAGLVGWLRLLPTGSTPLPGWSTTLVVLGLLTAVAGVGLGLTQRGPKVVLAYSSISQMGFMTLLVGAALAAPPAAPVALAAAAAYALHHGVAKAVLFLGVGLLPGAGDGLRRRLLLAGMIAAGLTLAGLPRSSGAFAKAWMKQALDLALPGSGVVPAASLAATGTTLLMARLLVLLRRGQPVDGEAPPLHLAAWGALVAAMLVLTPVAVPRVLPELAVPGLGSVVGDALWPVALGVGVALAVAALARRVRVPVPSVPAGDLVVVAEHGLARATRLLAVGARRAAALQERRAMAARRAAGWIARRDTGLDRLEDRLTRWPVGGSMVALLAGVLVLALWTFD